MTPDRLERKNPRLRGWDYGAGGTYFVTFCTSAHRPVLSSIRRGDPCGRPPLVLRLRGWDYGAGGTYFVTFCTSAHRPVLSSIRRGDPCGRPPLVLTPLGECVAEAIALTGVRVEHQVIMPNHVHLLLTL